jgi:hypothetical protein
MNADEIQFRPLNPMGWLPSPACLAFMAERKFDPRMPVMRAIVTPAFMVRMKLLSPGVANTVQLLFGPFGIVEPTGKPPFRVAELQVGTVIINVEEEYNQ